MDASKLANRLNLIEELRPAIVAGGDEAQKIRRLPDDLVTRLVHAGFFRFALPAALGGDDARNNFV